LAEVIVDRRRSRGEDTHLDTSCHAEGGREHFAQSTAVRPERTRFCVAGDDLCDEIRVDFVAVHPSPQ